MSHRPSENIKVMSIRVSEEMKARIKAKARERGLTPCVYVRTLLYEKFPAVAVLNKEPGGTTSETSYASLRTLRSTDNEQDILRYAPAAPEITGVHPAKHAND